MQDFDVFVIDVVPRSSSAVSYVVATLRGEITCLRHGDFVVRLGSSVGFDVILCPGGQLRLMYLETKSKRVVCGERL